MNPEIVVKAEVSLAVNLDLGLHREKFTISKLADTVDHVPALHHLVGVAVKDPYHSPSHLHHIDRGGDRFLPLRHEETEAALDVEAIAIHHRGPHLTNADDVIPPRKDQDLLSEKQLSGELLPVLVEGVVRLVSTEAVMRQETRDEDERQIMREFLLWKAHHFPSIVAK
jgi:hypothetical protein